MSEARIEAVILKQQDYRENDALITVLSKDYGKLGFVCRGIRKMASKNAVSCMPFVLSELMFDYKEQATLFSLKSARVLAAHRHIREDLEKMAIAQVMCEIADKLLEQGESDLEAAGEVYELLSVSLDRLDSEADSYLILAQFTALALKTEGIEPVVDECVLCSNTQVQTISVEDGGFSVRGVRGDGACPADGGRGAETFPSDQQGAACSFCPAAAVWPVDKKRTRNCWSNF